MDTVACQETARGRGYAGCIHNTRVRFPRRRMRAHTKEKAGCWTRRRAFAHVR
jgi:hypothetical protein